MTAYGWSGPYGKKCADSQNIKLSGSVFSNKAATTLVPVSCPVPPPSAVECWKCSCSRLQFYSTPAGTCSMVRSKRCSGHLGQRESVLAPGQCGRQGRPGLGAEVSKRGQTASPYFNRYCKMHHYKENGGQRCLLCWGFLAPLCKGWRRWEESRELSHSENQAFGWLTF